MKRPDPTVRFFAGPWPYFAVFLFSNLLLSYTALPFPWKGTVLLAGVLLPMAIGIRFFRLLSPSKGTGQAPAFPPGAWILLGAAAILARFTSLDSLSAWPHYDEGVYAHYALGLLRGDPPLFLYGHAQWPPFFVAGMALTFNLMGPSLGALWAWPALLSLLTVPAAYGAARQFLSRDLAFFSTGLAALGFWPLYSARCGSGTVLIPLFLCSVLYLLGRFLNAPPGKGRALRAAVLGLALGLGFWGLYLHWMMPTVVLAVTLVAASRRCGIRCILAFWGALLAALSPTLSLAPLHAAGQYLEHLWPGGRTDPGAQLLLGGRYIACLFWGTDPDLSAYQPVGGGFLNPLLGALAFLGVLGAWRARSRPFERWLLLSLPAFLLPGLLSLDLEPFRVFPLWAPLAVLAAVGAGRLADSLRAAWRPWVLAGFLALSSAWDLQHLFGPYQRVWEDPAHWRSTKKSILNYRAHSILKDLARKKGPGLIFPSFVPGISDTTLRVACDGFNAAQNPGLPFDEARWAAVVTNVHYRPHLEGRFGGGRAYALGQDLGLPDGGWMLFVTDVTEGNRPVFAKWREADRSLGPFLLKSVGHVFGQDYSPARAALLGAEPAFDRDPFLTACFWEKIADDFVKVPGAPGAPARALQKALAAVPAAHLYRNLGIQRWIGGDAKGALQAFQMAARAPFDLTDSKHLAGQLKPPGKEGR